MNNLHRLIHKGFHFRYFHRSTVLRQFDIYEPTYLEAMKSKFPMYDTLNIQIRGHNYAILESYQKFVHNLMKNMEINVEDAWASPHQDLQVTTLKPKSELVNATYNLKIYERTVQITDLAAAQLPIILRALEASAPAGVTVQVLPHEEWHEEVRYVPDTELNKLKQELEDMGGPSKKR